ncbi:GAF and ANTAR domain-containing protein [Sinomonas susongensis]|uniref:GAF and ANTAR domain-containing protein n=1 Tax=Sinomonas susongensis TaxID=1324851 RepID=UPI0011090C58|nr:GAF and ANTAR domain-containing protein [Sinomonas susongensis]
MVENQEQTSVAELQNLLLDSADIRTFLDGLSSAAARSISGETPVQCSVTVSRERRPATMGVSAELAGELDQIQYAALEGPCIDALRTGHVVDVRDVGQEERWPRYTAGLRPTGIRSVLAVPIPLAGGASAALNCYSETPGAFGGEARQEVLEFAQLASTSVALAVRLTSESDRAADLATALESRTSINLAAGIIMAQSRCTSDEAIEILKRASNQRNVKLRDVASSILARFDDADPNTHFS